MILDENKNYIINRNTIFNPRSHRVAFSHRVKPARWSLRFGQQNWQRLGKLKRWSHPQSQLLTPTTNPKLFTLTFFYGKLRLKSRAMIKKQTIRKISNQGFTPAIESAIKSFSLSLSLFFF